MLKNLSIRIKLALLAGVPLAGALALASLLWMQAQKSAEAAAALGSVEDLAELSSRMTALVHGLQMERATLGLSLGHEVRAADDMQEDEVIAKHKKAGVEQRKVLGTRMAETDAALETLGEFLETKNLDALPKRLTGNLQAARKQLARLGKVRSGKAGEVKVGETIAFYADANNKLVEATAALSQLSDDGELLRSIAALVSVLQVKERASQEHALLANVFAASAFPPGTYRSFVTLTTQEQVYIEVLRSNAKDEQIKLYETSMEKKSIKSALAMRKNALATLDDDFGIEAGDWFKAQNEKIQALRELETLLTSKVRDAALAKLNETEASIRNSLGLSAGVLLASILLGILIARGVNQSIGSLGAAARKVEEDNDFAARATKRGNDELGALTDTFNHMLDGIQKRDTELEEYRVGLEEKVAKRTAELSERNDAMRMVLDNVEQGLVTIDAEGGIAPERSAIFDTWFGRPANDTSFGTHLAGGDENTEAALQMGWEEVNDGFLPLELTLDQMPSTIIRDGSHYTLSYKPIGGEEDFKGALLIVSNITEEVKRIKKEAEQREFINVFERVMKDKNGFVEFFNETEKILTRVLANEQSTDLMMRDIHTVKGNCGIFQIDSVAERCHTVESGVESGDRPTDGAIETLRATWADFATRVRTLLGEDEEDIIEVAYPELEMLLKLVDTKAPHLILRKHLEELRFEPTQTRLKRVGEQARSVADRLGKSGLKIEVESNGLRLPAERWTPFWANFAHVLRNAVDHGIEMPDEREEKGKPREGTLRFVSRKESLSYVIELHDDGAGIAWDRVKAKAAAAGMPHETQAHLEDALFSDGLSTRDSASEMSGRGVGMAAVKQITLDMGGRITIESKAGKGTMFRFTFPVKGNEVAPRMTRAPGARPSMGPPAPPSRGPKIQNSLKRSA